jgi:hypothetical protein
LRAADREHGQHESKGENTARRHRAPIVARAGSERNLPAAFAPQRTDALRLPLRTTHTRKKSHRQRMARTCILAA